MKQSILAVFVLMLCAVFVLADEPTTVPSTAPATEQAATYPTPAELIKKMKEMAAKKNELLKVPYFDLSRPITEKPADFSLFGDINSVSLRSLIERLHKARDDKDVPAVLVTLGSGEFDLAQAQEIRDALISIRKNNKHVFVYADGYDTKSYIIATGGTDICILGGGEIMMPGPGLEATFAKGLLDKVGVKADYIQIGEYKGADEQFTRTGPSDELRGELKKLVDNLYDQIVEGIATNRNLDKATVQQAIDDTILTAQSAKDRGMVDYLIDQDGLRDLIKDHLGKDIDELPDYGKPPRESLDLSNPFAIFTMMMKKPEASDKPAVALIYAQGMIIDGRGGEGLFGGGFVGGEDLRRALRLAARDTNVKSIVIRINSPGGSALASEVMWQATRRVAKDKPVIISIGGMAASGGYYLASAGETIFADPSAIVGSIGVVGGKFVLKDLYEKIGLTSESFHRGQNADLFSSSQPFSDHQREMLTGWMKQTYDQFTQRVMTTRAGKIKDIDKVARGRIFLAQQAKDLGMVDQIGGVEDAIAFAAKKVNLVEGNYDVKVLPVPKTLADLFNGDEPEAMAAVQPKIEISPDSILRALSPAIRRQLAQQFTALQLLQDRPVVLISPYTLSVR